MNREAESEIHSIDQKELQNSSVHEMGLSGTTETASGRRIKSVKAYKTRFTQILKDR